MNVGLKRFVPIQEVLGNIRQGNLTNSVNSRRHGIKIIQYLASNGDLFVIFISNRTLRPIGIVENYCYDGLRDTSLTTLVNQILLVGGAHLETSQGDA